ncbi:hypothetical protein LR48_Vigan2303s000100 [Vigna angularis]|nr:hypothetical protein LR48_Vigan2303s000100 [Vigna angularis]
MHPDLHPGSSIHTIHHPSFTVQPLRSTTSSNKAFMHLKKKHPNHHLTSMGGAHLRELL